MIDWNKVNKTDGKLIIKIVSRAQASLIIKDGLSLDMDLNAAHIASPIKLEELLNADDVNFAHDIYGIQHHINRDNGEMLRCFVPRFAA